MKDELKEMLQEIEALQKKEILLVRESKHREANDVFNAWVKLREEYYDLRNKEI